MKKLYAFLMALVVLGVISSEVAQAQTYSASSYLVRKIDAADAQGLGSGPNWNPLQGGTAFTGTGPYFSLYPGEEDVYCSNGVQLPFNVTFADKSLTTANTFSVTCNGNVILSPTWGATVYEEPLLYGFVEDGYIYGTAPTYTSEMYDVYDYGLFENEEDEGSYDLYANYTLMPFDLGYDYNYNPDFSASAQTKFSYSVLGSAPNRELVVETDNMHPFEEAFYNSAGPDGGSWQVVLYENAISKFQFNYGPTTGNPLTAANNAGYDQTPSGTINGYTLPGDWGYGYWYNEGSYWYYDFSYSCFCGMKTVAGQNVMIDWNGNGWNASKPFVYAYNRYHEGSYYSYNAVTNNYSNPTGGSFTDYNNFMGFRCDTARYLPQSSIQFAIAYPYDLTAGTISIPQNEQPQANNATLTPTATLTNSGSQVPTSCSVNFTITEVGVGQIYNKTLNLTSASIPQPFASEQITFPSFTLPGTNQAYGIYEDTMIVYNLQPTADQNPSDNETTNEWIVAPANDIKAVQVIQPVPGERTQIGVATTIAIRFRNLGVNSQTNVPLTAVVHDATGAVTFRDTVIVPNWPAGSLGGNSDGTQDYSSSGTGPGKGAYYDTAFPAFNATWTPATLGTDTVFGIAIMADDQLRGDDTTKSATAILPEYDGQAVGVAIPQSEQQMPYATQWYPAGLFASVGVADLFDVPLEVDIRRCSDGALVFKADTLYQALYGDQGIQRFYFPSDQGIYHTSQIPPGCYNMCVTINATGDINLANDTACTQFTVIDRLKGNYYVGVGRQFQTIHAAVDSMRFRGIGANVNLILTDTAYTENGQTDASDPTAAIDMRGISGLSDTSTVTWIPYPGQTNHIYFTGNQPYGFYMGDKFGWMNWEGYNPSTVPTPDKLTAEPTKRQMTITDNETNAGAAFGIEEGASNITIKDVIVHGNGMFSNDSDAVIRMWDEHPPQDYPVISDTVPMHNVMINNCEIGNAKYGLYDKGIHDRFDVQAGVWKSWRNYSNMFTRNTIGTSTNPLSYAGIQFNDENGIVISHNEVTNISTSNAGATGNTWNAFGIVEPTQTPGAGSLGDTGNVTSAWIDANRCHIIGTRGGITYGIALQEASTIYLTSGLTQVASTLPPVTGNRVTNNMLFDLRTASGQVYPILMMTSGMTNIPTGAVPYYSSDLDSVFNNSISTNNATANIVVQNAKHVFLWNNIFQNTSSGPYTNYWLEVPRPYAQSISSDYNLFDLHGTNNFDSVIEYDSRYGTLFQRLYFRRLNDWRTMVGQDMHSLTGNPLFANPSQGTDSLHMPPALTYVESPAYHNGIWLGTSTQSRDFDGDLRLQGTTTPSIGADEWDGFQYTNDLAVFSITQPAGFSQTSDTSLVTTQSPLWLTATVKNLSSVGVYNEPVTFTVQRSVNGVWTNFFSTTTAPLNWAVSEDKTVSVQGPTLTPVNDTGVFLVTVSVPNDQNNANNTQTKAFRILLKQNAVLLSYNTYDAAGQANAAAAMLALNNLGVPFDTLNRNNPNGLAQSTIIDYTPWWTIVWAMGDPTIPFTNSNQEGPVTLGPGQGALTLQETDEITRYLNAGLSYAKKSIVIAGSNLAYYNGFQMVNNTVTDTAFIQTTMATRYVANTPVSGNFAGRIVGQQPEYWKFSDSLYSASPDVIKPSWTTALVGPDVTGFAYTYSLHPLTPNDSGSATSHYNPTMNTVFYGFDWANPVTTKPGGNADTTSGVTRTLAGAFAFFLSHQGTVLPVSFVTATVSHASPSDALFQWNVASQKDVVEYDIEQQNQNSWTQVGTAGEVDNQLDYSKVVSGFDPSQSYTFRIAAVDATGTKTYSNTMELGSDASALGFTLGQSYPNPTPGLTEIGFTLPEAAQVTIRVLDVTGKIVNSDISNASFAAGAQTVKLDLSSLPSGSYIYEMMATGADGQTATLSSKLTVEKN